MSATKHMRKVARLASQEALEQLERELEQRISLERNVLKRSSYRQQLQIVRDEQRLRINDMRTVGA